MALLENETEPGIAGVPQSIIIPGEPETSTYSLWPDNPRALLGLKRYVATIHDANGEAIYDQEAGTNILDTNIKQPGMSLLHALTARELERVLSPAEIRLRLAIACAVLPSDLTCKIDSVNIYGAKRYAIGDRYPSLKLDFASQLLAAQEKETVSRIFGLPSLRSGIRNKNYNHISMHVAKNQDEAEDVRRKIIGQIPFPATVVFRRSSSHGFRR